MPDAPVEHRPSRSHGDLPEVDLKPDGAERTRHEVSLSNRRTTDGEQDFGRASRLGQCDDAFGIVLGDAKTHRLSAIEIDQGRQPRGDRGDDLVRAEFRARLHDFVAGYRGTLVVVSHDRELLEHVDRIGEVRQLPDRSGARSLTWYGGGWSAYAAAVAAEQDAAEQALTTARNDVRRQQRDLADAQVVLARRKRYGDKMAESLPRIVASAKKRAAQESAGKLKGTHQQRLEDARERLDQARDRVRDDREIVVDLPATDVPRGRTVLVLDRVELRTGRLLDLELRGPERVAVTGANGSGKSTLLHTLTGELPAVHGTVHTPVPVRLLPQRLGLLDPTRSVVDNARDFAPAAEPNAIRAALARFLFRGRAADRLVGALSGGELFRATLACLLLAEPAPRLLLLDEPTNNLDLASVRQLVSALASYRGALMVASHDEAFLAEIGITRRMNLET